MGATLYSGVLLVLLGSAMGGSFALPGKRVVDLPWELLWGPFFFFVTLVLPLSAFLIWSKDLMAVWQSATIAELLPPILFGVLWGLGSMVSVRAYAMAGLSLTYTVNRGVMVVIGSSIPLIFGAASGMRFGVVLIMVLGIATCLLGVLSTGYAGSLRERLLKNAKPGKKDIVRGILFAGMGGLLASCMNFAFAFGQPLIHIAREQLGSGTAAATLAIWIMALFAGSITSFAYCLVLIIRKRNSYKFSAIPARKIILLASLMALLHNGAIFFYGLGSDLMGKIGPGIGYAMYASGIILVGNMNGFLSGEWKGSTRKIRTWQLGGMAILVLGIIILAYVKT